MNAKDEVPKSKFKQFLKAIRPGTNGRETRLRPEIERDLRPEQPVAHRLKKLRELCEPTNLQDMNLDERVVIKLWELTKDLIVPNKTDEARQTTFIFYKQLIQTQYKALTLMREKFFLVIENHSVEEDLRQVFEMLDALTENGKDITNFEEKMGNFMLNWLPAIQAAGLLGPFIAMFTNLIKFNAAHMDKTVLIGAINNFCDLCTKLPEGNLGKECIDLMDVVLTYAIFPSEPMPYYVATLCRCVNLRTYCPLAWRNMKNLLGTTLGHHAIKLMVSILNDHTTYGDDVLLRGIIFCFNMNAFIDLPRSNEVKNVYYAPIVFSCFLKVLKSRIVVVTYEVLSGIGQIVEKECNLPDTLWDMICDIMMSVLDNMEFYNKHEALTGPEGGPLPALRPILHKVLNGFENFLRSGTHEEQMERVYDIIERVAHERPEESVLNLIEHRRKVIKPTRAEWLEELDAFVQRYYSIPNTNVQIKTIEALVQIVHRNRIIYEQELIEKVVLKAFANAHLQPNVQVRVELVHAIVGVARLCETSRCLELINILGRLLNRPFVEVPANGDEHNSSLGTSGTTETDPYADVLAAADGLITLCQLKLYRSFTAAHAVKIYILLVDHLDQQYANLVPLTGQAAKVRHRILSWLLGARISTTNNVGFPDASNNDNIKYSYHVYAELQKLPQQQMQNAAKQPAWPVWRTYELIRRCLEKESDIHTFQMLLVQLPKLLLYKSFSKGNDIGELARKLITLCSTPGPRTRWGAEEVTDLVLPSIVALIPFRDCLQLAHQKLIISTLNSGLHSPKAKVCMLTLSIIVVEMPEAMANLLPDVLLQVSKLSDNYLRSLPTLEFLSLLSRVPPRVFANFTPKQYMYPFASSLPYTVPHRYDTYTVLLAHHVISSWFMKCKMDQRHNYIHYVMSSLQSNGRNLVEGLIPNEDSTDRKRSASLSERNNRSSAPIMKSQEIGFTLNKLDEYTKNCHLDLIEVCHDFLARNAFSPSSAIPKRSPAMDILFKHGQVQSWVIGNNIVTITTAGCPFKPTQNGLCERCARLAKNWPADPNNSQWQGSSEVFDPTSPETTVNNSTTGEQRHSKSSLQHSGNDSGGSTELTSTMSNTSGTTLTQRQLSNNSTASLDQISRRNSQPEGLVAASGDPAGSSSSLNSEDCSIVGQKKTYICARSCVGWAEVYIRRPTGDISWIMRMQNPIMEDCFGHDMSFGNMISLFLPTSEGGTFGPDDLPFPDFTGSAAGVVPPPPVKKTAPLDASDVDANKSAPEQSLPAKTVEPAAAVGEAKSVVREPVGKEKTVAKIRGDVEPWRHKAIAQARALIRQEEIASLTGKSAAIDIPTTASMGDSDVVVGKDANSGSVSDSEVDDAFMPAGKLQGDRRTRNPVRRVNSSPEMGQALRAGIKAARAAAAAASQVKSEELQQTQPPKKKNVQYCKEPRVSCEAIPEESPPQNSTALIAEANVLPPKQHSADDVSSSRSTLTTNEPTKPPMSPDIMDGALNTGRHASSTPKSLASKAAHASLGHSLSKSRSTSSRECVALTPYSDYNSEPMLRARSKTISVVREATHGSKSLASTYTTFCPKPVERNTKVFINPAFVLLQLYNTGQLSVTDRPLKVPNDLNGMLTTFDYTPPFTLHNIGVMYVGRGQCNNVFEILGNRHGSTRYTKFLTGLGMLVDIKDAKDRNIFLTLEKDGTDGRFAYVWHDDVIQVTFHVATLMPTNLEKDPKCNEKKKHIGNDFVHIVYNESGEEYDIQTITGQFSYAAIIIEPTEMDTVRIRIKSRPEIAQYINHAGPELVSDNSAPILARQYALHADLASRVQQSIKFKSPYSSHWLERLRKIKELRTKIINLEKKSGNFVEMPPPSLAQMNANCDFTKYT